jgi:hypothetical protein
MKSSSSSRFLDSIRFWIDYCLEKSRVNLLELLSKEEFDISFNLSFRTLCLIAMDFIEFLWSTPDPAASAFLCSLR